MLPAHVDAWAQTSPAPWPDPDPALFLHGPRRGVPDVQVCWRQDLDHVSDQTLWPELVALLPPSSGEGMPVPLHALRAWLKHVDQEDVGGDVSLSTGDTQGNENRPSGSLRPAVLWGGPDAVRTLSQLADLDRIRPGDTLVLPASAGDSGRERYLHP
jgi:CRISPR-associated endonuclease/helicase Cas3